MDGAFWRRCRPPRSPTVSTISSDSSTNLRPDAGSGGHLVRCKLGVRYQPYLVVLGEDHVMKPNRTGLAATCAFVLGLLVYATPAIAQSGQLKGKVVDAQNKPVADAKIIMEAAETSRKVETKSNGKGEYIQIGLPPGNYKVTATKGDLSQTYPVRVGLEMKEL